MNTTSQMTNYAHVESALECREAAAMASASRTRVELNSPINYTPEKFARKIAGTLSDVVRMLNGGKLYSIINGHKRRIPESEFRRLTEARHAVEESARRDFARAIQSGLIVEVVDDERGVVGYRLI
jgi:hypothetical protein